ncbi:NCS2 family permease [Rubinisphaera margarita]|uniref:NCS2 family permease n=1 Tax=Rubinisphaera margarita TaxID=2909586 RepID=UPI001EE902D2|nr:NCS2 family permease [Rubinisphaera margarita]MCG6158580.1 NCS2 family permease [Rubinisphaera margarita]
MSSRYPLFVKRDIDGFFGLFIDNIVQLLLILGLCAGLCGMSGEHSNLLFQYIFPGAAASILIGNIFYAWQAHRLARRTGRDDITALPYGINTPSLLVYVFFVMLPVYLETQDPVAAWRMGLIACLGSGVIELIGAIFAGAIRRYTPRAALLSTLAGIAIGFIAMTFTLQIFFKPLIAMPPLGVLLLALFARARFPLGLPGGLVAVLIGTATAWLLTLGAGYFPQAPQWLASNVMSTAAVSEQFERVGLYLPVFVGGEIVETLKDWSNWLGYLSVIIPMGLFNIIGSMQNIESAEAGGDSFHTGSSMAINGIGTIVAALFGSCFPTTIYIGHPGWKELGARAGYSTLNGIVITVLCFSGLIGLASAVVPIEAGVAIVLWIGIIITAQAFQATPNEHAPAVAMGLFPAIAAWGATVMSGAFLVSGGTTIQAVLDGNAAAEVNGFLIEGLLTLERGYIFTCMILSAVAANLIDRRYFASSLWAAVAAVLTLLGLMHAYQLQGNVLDYWLISQVPPESARSFPATGIAIGYAAIALVCLLAAVWHRRDDGVDSSHSTASEDAPPTDNIHE